MWEKKENNPRIVLGRERRPMGGSHRKQENLKVKKIFPTKVVQQWNRLFPMTIEIPQHWRVSRRL